MMNMKTKNQVQYSAGLWKFPPKSTQHHLSQPCCGKKKINKFGFGFGFGFGEKSQIFYPTQSRTNYKYIICTKRIRIDYLKKKE